jgi:hypothetical protein
MGESVKKAYGMQRSTEILRKEHGGFKGLKGGGAVGELTRIRVTDFTD